jgi:hypothetical protein
MSDGAAAKKSEGRWGFYLTLLGCLGFLYYWFRPQRLEMGAGTHESAAQLVGRAMAEPATSDPVRRAHLDVDLLEVCALQARLDMTDDALATARLIGQPDLQAHAVEHLANVFLASDPAELSGAFRFAREVRDEALRADVEAAVYDQLALMGYVDVVAPKANTPLQMGRLVRMVSGADGQAFARERIAELETSAAALPTAEAAQQRENIAMTRINLALEDGPAAAIAAIQQVPAERQAALWIEVFRSFLVRKETPDGNARLVYNAVSDEVLRRTMEIEALQSFLPLRTLDEMLTEARAAERNATSDHERVVAGLHTVRVLDAGGRLDDVPTRLRELRTLSAREPDARHRARDSLLLATAFANAVLLEESSALLMAAHTAALSVTDLAEQRALLVLVGEESLIHAQPDRSQLAVRAAWDLRGEAPPLAPELVNSLALLLVGQGQMSEALTLIDQLPEGAPRRAAFATVARRVTDDVLGYAAPVGPAPVGQSIEAIRARATLDEAAARQMVEQVPAGHERARAWLALAKGISSPPLPSPTDPENAVESPPMDDAR